MSEPISTSTLATARMPRLTYQAWVSSAFLLLFLPCFYSAVGSRHLPSLALPSLAAVAAAVVIVCSVRRLRDLDVPGTAVIFLLVPFANAFGLLVLLSTAGTGPNRYGVPAAAPSRWAAAAMVTLGCAALAAAGFSVYVIHALSKMNFMM